jgi:hypothetical protein
VTSQEAEEMRRCDEDQPLEVVRLQAPVKEVHELMAQSMRGRRRLVVALLGNPGHRVVKLAFVVHAEVVDEEPRLELFPEAEHPSPGVVADDDPGQLGFLDVHGHGAPPRSSWREPLLTR